MIEEQPSVIVIAERCLSDLLTESEVAWHVQERQPSVSAMWDGLSGGRLSTQSQILLFSDSLLEGTPSDGEELDRTAQAILAMANAGADIFVAIWRPLNTEYFQGAMERARLELGEQSQSLSITYLPMELPGGEILGRMREVLGDEVKFPGQFPASVNRVLSRVEPLAPAPPDRQSLTLVRPALPPLDIGRPGETGPRDQGDSGTDSLTSGASAELLARPVLPGQMTITVTSSKGGSGKSTASLLLAASIARASMEGGRPLKVCLVDMDTRDGQIASLIGKYMPTALNIRVQPIWDELTIRRHLVREDSLGIDTLLAPIRPRTAETVGPQFYRTIIRSLQRMYDVVVMDTSVQYLDPLIAKVCLPEATEILFITTLASTAVQGMARALREITAPIEESGLGISRDKIGIIVNQSVAGVGMQREQILAAGLGVPVVGVIPLATKDVLTATNMHRMSTLLDHSLLGPAYNDLARTCLPGRGLAEFVGNPTGESMDSNEPFADEEEPAMAGESASAIPGADRRKMRFRRA